jgi:hypothetical protein
MKRARIDHLHAIAKMRKPGYLEACLRAGQASPDGLWIIFDDDAHRQIRREFNPTPSGVLSSSGKGEGRGSAGLGDLIHKVAGPIGRALRWPCMKGDGTTDLKPGSPCARARRVLNTIHGHRGERSPISCDQTQNGF